jgi:hypothetical protein
LVYSIHDDDVSTEAIIQRMIERARRMIKVNNNSKEEEPEIPINPAAQRHKPTSRGAVGRIKTD